MPEIEAPDQLITLKRAAALAGLTTETLKAAARQGRLEAEMPGNEYLTTRLKLHKYLMGRRRGVVKPLPDGYVAPDDDTEKR